MATRDAFAADAAADKMSASFSPAPPGLKAETSPTPGPSSILAAGSLQTPPAEVLEMEDWELAPGRITEVVRGASPAETIAFSKPSLSTKTGVEVCEDVFFRIETIHPGETRLIDAVALNMRICSVAAGKVRVTLDLEPEFVLGTHGMFRVRPAVGAVVQNTWQTDAILHITTLVPY